MAEWRMRVYKQACFAETSDAFLLLNCARVTPLHPISQLRSAYTACGALFHTFTVLPQYFLQTSKKSGLEPPWIAFWPYVLAQQPRVWVHEDSKPILSVRSRVVDQPRERTMLVRDIVNHLAHEDILRGWVLDCFLIWLRSVQGTNAYNAYLT